MDETTMLVLAAASAPALPALLKSVYADLLQPSVRRVGLALEDVIGLGNTALYPVQLLNGRTSIALKSNFDKYRKKLEDVLDADIIRVAPEVGVPIAEKLAYVTEPKLSDFYVTLLAKASQRQFAFQAHPGFVKAIDHLSPDDAAMIEHFAS